MKNSVISSYQTLVRNIQILNLCAQRGLGQFTKTDYEFDEKEDSDYGYDQEDTTDFSLNEVEISGDDTSIVVKISKFVDWDIYHYWTFKISVSDFESVSCVFDEYIREQNLINQKRQIELAAEREKLEKEAVKKRRVGELSDFEKVVEFQISCNDNNADYLALEKIIKSLNFYLTEDFVRINNQNVLCGYVIRYIKKGMKIATYHTKISFLRKNTETESIIKIQNLLKDIIENA